MFIILFEAHGHSLFNYKNVLYHPLNPLFNFMLQQELLTAEEILSKMFADSRLKSSTTSSEIEGLPGDFLLSTLPVRTKLLITSLISYFKFPCIRPQSYKETKFFQWRRVVASVRRRVGGQSRASAQPPSAIGCGECVPKQAPPPGTCSTFSECFYLLHSYPPSVPVASALPQLALQRTECTEFASSVPRALAPPDDRRTALTVGRAKVRHSSEEKAGDALVKCAIAMDTMDSASEHSSHASSGSPAVAAKPPSPPVNANTHSSPRQASPLGPPLSMAHPLSPPPVSSASLRGMALGHLPPPGLGLLNSLGVLHGPLDLMAHHAPPRSYNSPPPISTSDPTANECKLVDYRGQKVAAFIIAGDTMLCLPQAFELFLKHLVGGLHTVYTKLKRLDIVPLVCNVEQVRILRGLGAIQPGVNRCKLLSCKDFDTLYRDCTTASSRPGRPPKRAPVGLSLAASHLQHQQLKKQRLDNGDYPYENGHMGDMSRLEKSPLLANGYNHPPHLSHMQFMQIPHPAAAHSALLSPAMPHNLTRHDGSVIKNQGMPTMEAIARSGIWENCRAAYEDIVKHLERLREERCDPDRPLPLDQKARDLSPRNGSPTDHSPVLNLSKSGGGSAGSLGDGDHSGSEADGPDVPPSPRSPRSAAEDDEDDNISDPEEDDEKDQDMDEGDLPLPAAPGSDSQQAALNYSTLASAVASANGPSQDPSISSTETLLRNIQGLLKVAADNARQQERQINYEKAELKMDVLREREVKDSLERQLLDEQKMRGKQHYFIVTNTPRQHCLRSLLFYRRYCFQIKCF
ncbi:hypothetical protein Zmor_010832 [Zophobas morio]|uniref:SKI/SNO/DAC domain-containing protein n=1 Tax=Zophobas morio TaxID=2755281 RepID=A0AA38ISD6_9CUCU|nr:hypothetical protein Zmor_010832 [Zophobas morio]